MESRLEPIKPIPKARVGLYSIGHEQYWRQFEGLRERLIGYGRFIEKRLGEWCEVTNVGMVDNVGKAHQAGERFNAQNVGLIFCHVATYSMSDNHLAIPQICSRPLVVLNLQPALRMDYGRTDTAEWLAHAGACCIPEIANAFVRSCIPFHMVSGVLGLPRSPEGALADEATENHPAAVNAWKEIQEWVTAAAARRALGQARIGFLGHTYPGMLDMYSDFTMIQAQTGLHMEILEMCDLARLIRDVTPEEKKSKLKEAEEFFVMSEDSPSDPLARRPTPEQLDWSCTVACAQEKLVREFDLDGLTYYYRGAPGNEYEHIQEAFILGHSLLTGRGIPCAGEGDTKTCIAMKICDACGAGGSYAEIVGVDYVDQTIMLGHDGPFHIGISDEKPILRGMGLYHGKWGSGVSVEAKVRRGPVTTLGITQNGEGRLEMIANQGEATDGPILQVGNTMTPVRFPKPLPQFMADWFALGPTHHFALSVGHNADLFRRLSVLLGWPFKTACL